MNDTRGMMWYEYQPSPRPKEKKGDKNVFMFLCFFVFMFLCFFVFMFLSRSDVSQMIDAVSPDYGIHFKR